MSLYNIKLIISEADTEILHYRNVDRLQPTLGVARVDTEVSFTE